MLRRAQSETELRVEVRKNSHRSIRTRHQNLYVRSSNAREEQPLGGVISLQPSDNENRLFSPGGALSPTSRGSVASGSSVTSPISPKSAPTKRYSGDFPLLFPPARTDNNSETTRRQSEPHFRMVRGSSKPDHTGGR